MAAIRKTKIVATLGPASKDPEVLARMIDAGVNVVRLNFSHGTAEEHIRLAERVRALAWERRRPIGVLCDLQGPKIRIGKFAQGKIQLSAGDPFILDAECPLGDQERVGLDYPTLPDEVEPGAVLLLDDGRIVMTVNAVRGREIHCTVKVGGVLSDNKGINRKGGGLSAAALTAKDRADIKTAVALEADYVAVSFPRCAADVYEARRLVQEAGGKAHIVAKVERAEAVAALKEIIQAADAIMVARGDLGVEVGDAVIPGLQKKIIRLARSHNKAVITATQMMESMVASPIPTRAEVSDVANAVLDGTDAVMLSAETAIGKYPVEAVEAMHRVCLEAESEEDELHVMRRAMEVFHRIDEAIAMSAVYVSQHLKVKAIATLTESGSTAIWISRAYPQVPIYALSAVKETRRKLTLFRGVHPYPFEQNVDDRDQILHDAEEELRSRGAVKNGDLILLTIGEPIGKPGGTNTLKIVRVGEHR
ncbi:MAG: pyruvate kinase [Methylophilaceae bacterium]|nr:pyruvate kinase [Methylophilaceae bacterium]